jgi:2-dehydropantoate 2-reductase
MRGAIGQIVAEPGGAELSLKMLDESASVATACDHKPSEGSVEQNAGAMTAPGSPLTSSMYRDLRKGAPVEVDHILGDFIERGGAHGVATPLSSAACRPRRGHGYKLYEQSQTSYLRATGFFDS